MSTNLLTKLINQLSHSATTISVLQLNLESSAGTLSDFRQSPKASSNLEAKVLVVGIYLEITKQEGYLSISKAPVKNKCQSALLDFNKPYKEELAYSPNGILLI